MATLAHLIENARQRTPTATVMIGSPLRGISPRRAKLPNRPGVISLAQQFGQPISGGTITIIDPPFVPQIKDTIEIRLGYNGQELPAFTGFVIAPTRKAYPREYTIQIADILWLADFAAPSESEINLGNNKSARDCLIALLRDWAGIPDSRIAIPEIEKAPGQPWILGQLTPIAWRGISPLAAAQQICTPLGLWLFADAGGIVRIVSISGAPTEQPYRTLIEGEHLLVNGAPTVESNAASIYTRATVTGAATGIAGAQIRDSWQTDSTLLPPGKHRELSYSNTLIEYLNEADGGAASITAVAKRMLAEHSRAPAVIRLRIKGDPRAYVGRTIGLQSSRSGYDDARPFFIYGISTTYGAGQYDAQLTLDGGIGDAGYTLIPPPLAAFSYFLHEETLDRGQVIEVFTDAATSKSLGGGEIAAYAWTDDSTPPQTGSAQKMTFIYPATQLQALITLIVTDTNGKTATISTLINLAGDAAGQPSQRVLNFAAGNAWYITPDGGATWRIEEGEDALAVPPIGAAGSAEADPAAAEAAGLLTTGGTGGTGGHTIRRTLDKLQTASETLATLPGPIRFLWQNERTPARLWAAVGDTVYRSIDGGANFEPRGAPAPGQNVNWIVEAFNQENTIDVLAGQNAFVSFDGGATYATSLDGPEGATARNLASGFDRHWIGFSSVTAPASPLRSTEGDLAAFPLDLDPPVTSIQALTMLIDAPILYAIDQAARIWRLSAEDGGSAEHVATMPEAPTP